MCLIFPITTLFEDDLAKRGIHSRMLFWEVALVPLFGPLLYLCWRPPLPTAQPINQPINQEMERLLPAPPSAFAPRRHSQSTPDMTDA